MTSQPNPSGRVLHRICPSCDRDITEAVTACPTCGSRLVEIRDEADALIGTVIDDRFEIRDKLGQGGMGTVYRAWQRSVGREVAIKLIDRSFSRDPMGVRRFLREARLASQLSQPNTVSVFDFGQAGDGRLFIAMELIRGKTLHEVVKADGAFSVERTKRIGVQICDALEAAHSLSIVHRDLKLENVIVLDHPPGRDLLKVLDFGLAKNIRDPGSNATESGIVVGTPRYMAPETAMSGQSLPASDVYALGVMLGELVTGKPLWEGDNLPQLVQQKLDVDTAVARVPFALRLVVKALLDPEPLRRPSAAQTRELLGMIDEANAGDTVLDPDPAMRVTANLRAKSEPAQLDDDSARTRQLTPDKLARATTTPAAQAVPASAPTSSTSLDSSLVSPPRASRRVALAVLVAAVAAVAIAVGVFINMRGGSKDLAATPIAAVERDAGVAMLAPDAAAPDPAPAVTSVKLRIEAKPAHAIIEYRGAEQPAPVELAVERGDTAITMKASAKGYQTLTFTVTPSRDQTKQIVLKKLAIKKPTADEATPF